MSEMTIDQALEKLEKNAEALRSGELSIDDSIALYEESRKLYDKAYALLNDIRQKIEIYDPEKDETRVFDDIQL